MTELRVQQDIRRELLRIVKDTQEFTVNIANPGVLTTLSPHGFITGNQVFLSTTGALPTGLQSSVLYYVINITSNTLQLATTRSEALAGTGIETTGTESGAHAISSYLFVQPDINDIAIPNGAVIIEDWMSVLNAPNENSPYAIIDSSDIMKAKGVQTNDGSFQWNIPLSIIETFVDYQITRPKLRRDRQFVIDTLSKPNLYDNASGILAFGIRSIETKTPIFDILDRYDKPENIRDRYPIYIGQTINISVEEKSV